MDESTLLNVIFLCLANFFFLIVGIAVNVVVLLCIWKSSQLRKKLCYFMIFVLSGYDLLVVLVSHPLVIISAVILFSKGSDILDKNYVIFSFIVTVISCFSLLVLLILTLERYLGLAYPLFHKTSVTKRRLTFFIFIIQFLSLVLITFSHVYEVTDIDLYTLIMAVVLIILMNIRMFFIAKSKRTASAKGASNVRKYYICLFALASFTVCTLPSIIYYKLIVMGRIDRTSKSALLYFFWTITLVSINSSANSIIFFWNNSVLRSEGKKIIKIHYLS